MPTPPDFTAYTPLSAATLNKVGLWLVKSQTIGSGVASVTVTSAFSADYDNYLITLCGGSASADGDLQMILGSTTAGYYMALPYSNYSAGTAAASTNNGASWQFVGSSRTTLLTLNMNVLGPFLSHETAISGWYIGAKAGSVSGAYGGFLDNTTSYTAFTLTPLTGTLTGGTICVYGYNNG